MPKILRLLLVWWLTGVFACLALALAPTIFSNLIQYPITIFAGCIVGAIAALVEASTDGPEVPQ
jgi:hypothetical protein